MRRRFAFVPLWGDPRGDVFDHGLTLVPIEKPALVPQTLPQKAD